MESPTTIKRAPARNLMKRCVPRGVRVKFSTETMRVIGRTASTTSLNFSLRTSKAAKLPSSTSGLI